MEAESLTPFPLLNSLTETRLDLDLFTAASSVAHVQLPSTSAFSRQTRVAVKVLQGAASSHDETDFQKRNAASASSIFFRSGLEENEAKYPRAISWRVLEGGSVLELRSLDLTRPASQSSQASQVLRYAFPSPIRTGGVALADATSDRAICVFVMTKSNDLYTFSLRPKLFARPAPASDDVQRSFQIFRPSALSISTFYKLFASNSRTLLLSLGDGRVVRLTRKDGEDGAQWAETTFDDGQWAASLRGLLPWHPKPTVQFEGNTLNIKTIHTAVASPDEQHIFTTGLDHTLKAWSLATGKPTVVRDLLNQPITEESFLKRTIDPATTTTMRLFESRSGGGYTYYAATFSAQQSGAFKFWSIADPDNAENGIRDCFEETELKLPELGDGALWTLSDFDVRANADTPEIDVWILMRLNRRLKLFHRRFFDIHSLGSEWASGWEATAMNTKKHYAALNVSNIGWDQLDVSTRWLRYIFAPNRLPLKVVETAFSVYTHSKSSKSKEQKGSLPERVAMTVTAQAQAQIESEQTSADKAMETVETEWNNFWNIIRDVDNLRWEPLSLTIDDTGGIPWVAFTDGFSVIRDCSELEYLAYNKADDLRSESTSQAVPSVEDDARSEAETFEQASVVAAAAGFCSGFSDTLRESCELAFNETLWTDPTVSPLDRMQNLYDTCNFADEITTRQYYELRSSLEGMGGFGGLKSNHFSTVGDWISPSQRREPRSAFTKVGIGALIRGAHDTVTLQLHTLRELLYLVVFVFGEADASDELPEGFDLEPVFLGLEEQLKRAQLGHWLSTHTQSSSGTSKEGEATLSTRRSVTVLEGLFGNDIKPQTDAGHNDRGTLTGAIQDLLLWVTGKDQVRLDDALVSIQCHLLSKGSLDLAASFESFLPSSAWATYVRGRLCHAQGAYADAALCFQKSVFQLSRPHPTSSYAVVSLGLLSEKEAAHFSKGLGPMYTHIASLFEAVKAYVHVLTFARLALQHTPRSKPATSDLLQRVFRAALHLRDWDASASALTRLEPGEAQRKALRHLIEHLAAAGAIEQLLHLPLPQLQQEVDTLLADKARHEGDVPSGAGPARVPYFRILYAWRLRLGDARGAAAVLIERLDASKLRSTMRGGARPDQRLDEYLVGINALALVGEARGGAKASGRDDEDEGWVFIEGKNGQPRKVVRLDDLRDAYGKELDRLGMLEMGRFGIVGEEDEDEDEDMG